jgi:dolichol-phosphate mannosyltransferase
VIFIVLPAYNEAGSLGGLLTRINEAMALASLEYEVIVVNDGSTDRTLDIAERQQAAMPLSIVDHKRNRGLGEALKSGLVMASAKARDQDIIVTMDADNTHPPELIARMAEKIGEGYDVIIASRYQGGADEVGLALYRKALSRGASLLLRALFPMKGVRDYTCGYRAYRASSLKEAVSRFGDRLIEESGFSCMVELLLKLRRLGIRCYEVPLVLRYDQKGGASKMRVIRTIRRYLVVMARNLFQQFPWTFLSVPLRETKAPSGTR